MYNRTMKKLSLLASNPKFLGALYLLALPFYALIFQIVLPERSFFHATLQHEPKVQERSERVLKEIWDGYVRPGPRADGDCESLSPLAKSVNLDSLRIEGDDVSFSAIYGLGVWPTEYRIVPRIHFSLERNFGIPYRLPPGKGLGSVYKEVRVDGAETSPWGTVQNPLLVPRCLFPSLYDQKLPRNVALLRISAQLDQQIQELADDLRGVPRRESDGFWRMLYLSASTVTTTGFGDIVPLTTLARIVVTTESVVGVVLIGMFLNAIARRDAAPVRESVLMQSRALISIQSSSSRFRPR
jgi:hypothetical protein